MKMFLVCYDLRSPSDRYAELYRAFDELNSVRFQDSVYLVQSATLEPKDVYDKLINHVDPEDRLSVFQLDKAAQHCGWDLAQHVKQVAEQRTDGILTSALARLTKDLGD
ncbi:hypothetical protein ATN79_47155 [Paraburkholderia caribensis]|nr:hypothetical protein ATN79_47155 [Paraburkholderia caribensis]